MLDQVRDTNKAGLYQINMDWVLPDFVKTAAESTTETVQDLPLTAFAWPESRLFPVHTRADTWLSTAYFNKFAADIPEVHRPGIAKALATAAEFWGVDPLQPQTQKQAAAVPTYTIEYPLSGSVCSVGVSSAEEMLKVACDITTSGKYPYGVRRSVAVSILAAPECLRESLVPEIDTELHKLAGYGVGTVDQALTAIRQREIATEKSFPPISAGLKEASAMVQKAASAEGLLSAALLEKLGSMLDAVDRFSGLYTRYDKTFQPPEQQLFSITLRDVDDFAKHAVKLDNGKIISRSVLATANVGQWLADSFGQKCASAEDVVAAVQALPSRRADLLVQHLEQVQ